MVNFDKNIHKLGSICKYNHEYKKTGNGLRYISTRQCVVCNKLYNVKWRRANGVLPMNENKNCPSYLGIVVAEKILSKVFDDVIVMPYGNQNYDFICNHGKKIDVKSATTAKNGNGWKFHTAKNVVADYFLCLAFDNRAELNPLYMWLLPSFFVNDNHTVNISPSTISKWSDYRLDIDKVIHCCEILR